MIVALALQSIGIPVGTFIGLLIGLGMRHRSGNTEGLLRGSLFLTAAAGAMVAWLLAMIVNFFIGASA